MKNQNKKEIKRTEKIETEYRLYCKYDKEVKINRYFNKTEFEKAIENCIKLSKEKKMHCIFQCRTFKRKTKMLYTRNELYNIPVEFDYIDWIGYNSSPSHSKVYEIDNNGKKMYYVQLADKVYSNKYYAHKKAVEMIEKMDYDFRELVRKTFHSNGH